MMHDIPSFKVEKDKPKHKSSKNKLAFTKYDPDMPEFNQLVPTHPLFWRGVYKFSKMSVCCMRGFENHEYYIMKNNIRHKYPYLQSIHRESSESTSIDHDQGWKNLKYMTPHKKKETISLFNVEDSIKFIIDVHTRRIRAYKLQGNIKNSERVFVDNNNQTYFCPINRDALSENLVKTFFGHKRVTEASMFSLYKVNGIREDHYIGGYEDEYPPFNVGNYRGQKRFFFRINRSERKKNINKVQLWCKTTRKKLISVRVKSFNNNIDKMFHKHEGGHGFKFKDNVQYFGIIKECYLNVNMITRKINLKIWNLTRDICQVKQFKSGKYFIGTFLQHNKKHRNIRYLSERLFYLDVSDPSNPREVITCKILPKSIIPAGNEIVCFDMKLDDCPLVCVYTDDKLFPIMIENDNVYTLGSPMRLINCSNFCYCTYDHALYCTSPEALIKIKKKVRSKKALPTDVCQLI